MVVSALFRVLASTPFFFTPTVGRSFLYGVKPCCAPEILPTANASCKLCRSLPSPPSGRAKDGLGAGYRVLANIPERRFIGA